MFAFVLIFLFAQIIPARADGVSPITFHALNVYPAQSIEDGDGTIVWAGSFTNSSCEGIGCSNDPTEIYGGSISLHNQCDGVNCSAQDIYYKVVINLTWDSEYSEFPSLIFVKGQAGQELTDPCGARTHSVHYDGTCTLNEQGMISASNISTSSDPNEVHELFAFHLDHNGALRILSVTYSVTVSTSPIPDQDCSDQWLPGTKFASFQLSATNDRGVNMSQMSGWPEPGAWIIIRVASGTWKNNGTSGDLTGLSISDGSNDWHSLQAYSGTSCKNGSSYYVQIDQKMFNYLLRVADSDGNFSDNTGTLNIELYFSTYSPFKNSCDANYKVGALAESRTIQANVEDGIYIGTDPRLNDLRPAGGEGPLPDLGHAAPAVQMMMLEIDKGPAFDGVLYSYASQILDSTGWHNDFEFPYALCVVHLDTMGRVRIYFAYNHNMVQWKFRARDTDGTYANNQGIIGYSLYYVDALQIYNPGNPAMECSKYSHTDPGTSITLQANTGIGHLLTLTGNNIYAIETSSGPWSNNGSLSFDAAISDDGYTWYNLYDYPYILCASIGTDSDHALIYLQAMPGKTYRLRVNDAGSVFTDNTGSMVATIYGATTTIADWNPCSDNYAFTELSIPEDARHIAAQYTDGTGIPYIQNGKIYGLEISDKASWSIAGTTTPRYDAEISDDGGSTWQLIPLASFASCVTIKYEGDETTSRYRIIFTANGSYKLRVHGADPSNIGDLIYTLYTATAVGPGSNIGGTTTSGAYVPPEWKTTCYEVCNRPNSLFITATFSLGQISFGSLGSVTFPNVSLPLPDVGGWIDYARCALQKFLSICPEHIQAILSIRTMFDTREPFGTILELETAANNIKTQLDTLVSSGGESSQQYSPYSVIWGSGGGETGQTWGGVLPNSQGTPWDGTPLDFSGVSNPATGGESYTGSAYYAYCLTGMSSMIGEMSTTFCQGIGFIKTTMNWAFIGLQFILDLGSLYLVFRYIKRNWIDQR